MFVITVHLGAPDVGWSCTAFSSETSHALESLTGNCCCLAPRATVVGVSPDSLISVPIGVVKRAPRVDLACRLSRSRRSSGLPICQGSHLRLLSYCLMA
jgi:hypothetical protein